MTKQTKLILGGLAAAGVIYYLVQQNKKKNFADFVSPFKKRVNGRVINCPSRWVEIKKPNGTKVFNYKIAEGTEYK